MIIPSYFPTAVIPIIKYTAESAAIINNSLNTPIELITVYTNSGFKSKYANAGVITKPRNLVKCSIDTNIGRVW